MGTLANAALLVKDPTFMDWCMASASYCARQVLLESSAIPNHESRLALATSVMNDPLAYRTRFTVYLATDPEVAVKGSTAALVGEQMVLDKVNVIWTTISLIGSTL